jgi:hypothetical protein
MSHEPTFITDNLKLACALATAGFPLVESPERIVRGGREVLSFSFAPAAHGVKAEDLAAAFSEGARVDTLQGRVDEIVNTRQLTPEEYCLLAFDAARASMHTRAGLMIYLNRRTALRVQEISGGRTLIYREGTPRETLIKLANS